MTDFDDFSALGRKWASLYRTKETTYISVRHGGTWYLLYSRELFHVDEPLELDATSCRNVLPAGRAVSHGDRRKQCLGDHGRRFNRAGKSHRRTVEREFFLPIRQ